MGKRIFPKKTNESTSTICKVRNSERISISTENESGETEKLDTDNYNLSTEVGVRKLRKQIQNLTDIESSPEAINYKSVEIGLPFPFLVVNN